MQTAPTAPAPPPALPAHLWQAVQAEHVPVLAALERSAQMRPWSEAQLADSLRAGHWAELLLAPVVSAASATAALTAPTAAVTSPVTTASTAPAVTGAAASADTQPLHLPDGRLLLGYALAQAVLDEWHLLTLAVAPAQRRRGCGRLLLQRLAHCAQAQGARSLWLEVRRSNRAALALYAALGFDTVGQRRSYYPRPDGTGEDALVMRADLPLRAVPRPQPGARLAIPPTPLERPLAP